MNKLKNFLQIKYFPVVLIAIILIAGSIMVLMPSKVSDFAIRAIGLFWIARGVLNALKLKRLITKTEEIENEY